jgi:superfamily II DNA or RNA helicase/ribosomal protein L40E
VSRRFTQRKRMILAMKSAGTCANCSAPLDPSFHADHRQPYSVGGPTILSNGQALCPPCNLQKGAKSILLRDWQGDALTKALAWYTTAADRHFVINAAPGAGKTRAATAIAAELIDMGLVERVIVIAPRKVVVEQWAKQFEQCTGRTMAQITGKDSALGALSADLCATWTAVRGLEDAFQAVCRSARVLVICDEHHHAAIEAAWGRSADSAFADAAYALILTGTPVRSDGAKSIWLEQDRHGVLTYAEEGSYTLTYGDAVNLGYCRPVTFHRHRGEFTVLNDGGESFDVSADVAANVPADHPVVRHLQKALDFYRVAKTPSYEADGKTPRRQSYHGSMIEAASAKLDELREEMPSAGGLVIAPRIDVAEAFAKLITEIEGEPPMIVHSETSTTDIKIAMFRKKAAIRWIVSVGMISEGVDIPRLRVLVYLPAGTTELMFRQAVGRVVRSSGPRDTTRAYVVMPAFQTFEGYARRIEDDMPAWTLAASDAPRIRRCPICQGENSADATVCEHCEHQFPERPPSFRNCDSCGHKNPMHAENCQACGVPVIGRWTVLVKEALRTGVITRGVDLEEAEVAQAEAMAPLIREQLRICDDENVARVLSQIPKELLPALKRFFSETRDEGVVL